MTYGAEVGDLFELVTPTEIRTYVDNVHAAYTAFAKDVQKSNSLPDSDEQAWALLLANEKKFYASVGFFSTLSLGTMRTAEEFARLLTQWRERFRTLTGKVPGGVAVNIPSENNQIAVKNIGYIVGGLALLYGLSLAAPFLRSLGGRSSNGLSSGQRVSSNYYSSRGSATNIYSRGSATKT